MHIFYPAVLMLYKYTEPGTIYAASTELNSAPLYPSWLLGLWQVKSTEAFCCQWKPFIEHSKLHKTMHFRQHCGYNLCIWQENYSVKMDRGDICFVSCPFFLLTELFDQLHGLRKHYLFLQRITVVRLLLKLPVSVQILEILINLYFAQLPFFNIQ